MKEIISIIGLGYVGLPLASAFAEENFKVIGYDISHNRVKSLNSGYDLTNEVSKAKLKNKNLIFTNNISDIKQANFYIITVPTPIDKNNKPDLKIIFHASKAVGSLLKSKDFVIYESTVYPGLIEEECIPILEKFSGLISKKDFHVGYSPERINPGDKKNTIKNIIKVISAQDSTSLKKIEKVYKKIIKAGLYLSPSIKIAESAKVLENIQRDLNIALMNELSVICHKLNIDTNDVLNAAGSKWNFLDFRPGLVGGHCIGVDPYYLIHKAKKIGIVSNLLIAGRKRNNSISHFIIKELKKWLKLKNISNPRIAFLGVSFKENIPDIRNSKAIEIIKNLNKKYRIDIFDSVIDPIDFKLIHNLNLMKISNHKKNYDVVILAVPHSNFKKNGWKLISSLINNSGGLLMDIKSSLPRNQKPENIELWRL